MKTLRVRFFVAAVFLAAAAVAFANPFKSKIIQDNDPVLEITVPTDHFMKITNFTQNGGTDRGVVEVVLPGDTPNGGSTNVLAATRIDLSTGANSQNFPEIGNTVTISGPAIVKITPIVGAKLFITYKKVRDEGNGGGGGATVTPIPIFSATPIPIFTATPTPTFNPFISPTPFGG
jgi:archaellin